MILLLLSILILLLCFIPKYKEGFYSDTNTVTASSSLTSLKKNIENTKKHLIGIKNNKDKFDTTEIISKLQPILKSNKDSLYTKGIVDEVQTIVNELSLLQEDFDSIKKYYNYIDDINKQYDVYIEKIDKIAELLTHIPNETAR